MLEKILIVVQKKLDFSSFFVIFLSFFEQNLFLKILYKKLAESKEITVANSWNKSYKRSLSDCGASTKSLTKDNDENQKTCFAQHVFSWRSGCYPILTLKIFVGAG